jgi:tetratricopeptide (TPR) repeat protein
LDRENRAEAKRILDSVTAAKPPGNAGPLGYRWLELAEMYALAGEPSKARTLLERYERMATGNMKSFDQQTLEMARGWTAVAEGRHADAIEAFRRADVGHCTVCSLAPLAHAYDRAGQADSAIAVFERYLATPYWYRVTADGSFLAGTYERLGELYEAKGDHAKAREYYERFIALRRNADPELQPRVAQLRKRLAALRPAG